MFVSGLVQGVNFRWSTTQQARAHGLAGWVRNLDDGRVEAVFEGPREAVERVISWCREGPRHARVTGLDVSWQEPEGLEGFDLDR